MKLDVFTPVDKETGERYEWHDVEVVEGEKTIEMRGRGTKGIVIAPDGKKWQVIGKSCGAPHCMCDAWVIPWHDSN